MKQKVKIKTSSSGNVIRTILREELNKLVTKEELKKFENRFDAKMDFKLENLERKVDEKARKYRDQVLTSNDRLAKKFETVQQELGLGNLQMKRQLEDHGERIVILESAQKS